VKEFHLMQSVLKPGEPPQYSMLATFEAKEEE
jgi:hypothetical protein